MKIHAATKKLTKLDLQFKRKLKSFPQKLSHLFKTLHKKWSKLSKEIKNINLINKFKSTFLNFIGPRDDLIFAVHFFLLY